jgi:hypothetical protein
VIESHRNIEVDLAAAALEAGLQDHRRLSTRYDPSRDVFVCAAGEILSLRHEGKLRDLK